jgi:hypothetical protein
MRQNDPLNGAASRNVFPQQHHFFLPNCSPRMMTRKGRTKASAYDIRKELTTHRTIPIYLHATLENRLVIAFKELVRQRRAEVPRKKKQILANNRENKAHKVYLRVLDEDCHVFLPFILAISPRACVTFNHDDFFLHHKDRRSRLDLSTETKELLEGIARRRGFAQNPQYRKWIESISPKGPYEIQHRYSQISISRIPVLGDHLFDAIQASTQWKQERNTGGLTTDCLIALIPRSQNDDISITLLVGHERGLELINQLQPENVKMQRSIGMQTEKGKRGDPFILTYLLTAIDIEYECSRIAISRILVLGDLLFDAVLASARWKQERKIGGLTTDCLTVLIPRSKTEDISIILSIGHERGLRLTNQLQLELI